ncbi:MAG: adenine phosphoribosyltransferase [Conexivisphaerales archaeon]
MDWLKEVKEDLRKAKIVKIKQGDKVYDYIVNPLSSGVPEIPSQALWGCAYEMARLLELDRQSKILVPEAMGFHIGAALSMVTGLPLLMVRKRPYFLENERKITKKTGYEESTMYINSVKQGDRIVLVDSIIATGGTMLAILRALLQIGAVICDAAVVVEREGLGGVQLIEEETGVKVKSLLKVDIQDGKVVVRT